ncbi:MAG: hypothetical protein BSOLF_0503 [Candidatus Carbobacillus altaicus]|uniref:Uncharacterized protein n=1 Tax=Candidatus Carbonibacillus altaicus TaxID=2163959 RepID=A0A2R6Y0S1_9BACL|nr:MAG: hypothetical protein BSOLF_0503 [Candidatus Carbobacillus altaicus]
MLTSSQAFSARTIARSLTHLRSPKHRRPGVSRYASNPEGFFALFLSMPFSILK